MRFLILCMFLALVVGCNKKVKKVEPFANPVVVVQPPVVEPDTGTLPFIVPDKPPVVVPAVISDTLYFDFDSDQLTGQTIAALSVDQQYVKNARITYLRLTGSASPEGSTEYNQELSERRTEAVKRFMGVLPGVSVYCIGEGESRSGGAPESDWWKWRRVIVTNQPDVAGYDEYSKKERARLKALRNKK